VGIKGTKTTTLSCVLGSTPDENFSVARKLRMRKFVKAKCERFEEEIKGT
jgi:hypothetical protein